MKVIATLRNVEFGADPYELKPCPPEVDRAARNYLFARDAMRLAVIELIKAPSSVDRRQAVIAAQDSLLFGDSDLWDAFRRGGHYQRVFLAADHYCYLSDSQHYARPYNVVVDLEGRRPCPSCYGAGLYESWYPELAFAPCTVCNQTGSVTVTLPRCCRKDMAHVD